MVMPTLGKILSLCVRVFRQIKKIGPHSSCRVVIERDADKIRGRARHKARTSFRINE